MRDEPNNRKTENRSEADTGYHTREEWRQLRHDLKYRRGKPKPPFRYLFWGLLLILLAILFSLRGQGLMPDHEFWKAFILGLGAIFLIQAVIFSLDPDSRSFAVGRVIPGLILLLVGLNFLVNLSDWWPLILVVSGVVVLFISWFLQREIQKRKITQETLHESEVKYQHIIDNANSVIMDIDTRGKILFINKFALDFFGFQENELLGQNLVGTLVARSDSASEEQEKVIQDIVTTPEYFRKNGEKVWMIWTYKPIFDEENHLKEILCIGIDRTQQKMNEDLVAQRLKEDTALEERTRLARDLHDAVSQTLFSASLMADVLPRVWERNQAEGLKKLEEVRQLTRGALAEMRTLLFELRPAALADAELRDLLHQLAESVMGRALLPVALEVEGTCKIPSEVKIGLYRIAQESLNNIVKHSGASRVQVTLNCRPRQVTLHIIDNGQGFDISQVAPGSFGLGNMRERADHIGASLKIESKVNEGTEVTVVWDNQTEEVAA